MVPFLAWWLLWLILLIVSYYSPVSILLILATTPLLYRLTDLSWRRSSARPLQEQPTIKLFNWNTLYWTVDHKPGFYQFLQSQNADVYHLQEALNHDEEIIDVRSELQEYFPDYQIVQSGELVSMTRLPVVGSFADDSLPYLRLDLDVAGKVVSFYNVHIIVHIAPENLKKSVSLFLRNIKERFARRKVEYQMLWNALENNQLPKVISGDFNTAKSQVAIRRFLRKYQDSFSALHVGMPRTYAFAKRIKLWRIDYVLVSSDLNLLKNDYIDPQLLSDHVGSSVSFQVQK